MIRKWQNISFGQLETQLSFFILIYLTKNSLTRQQIKIAPCACPKFFSSTFPAHLRFHIQKGKTPQLEWMAIKKKLGINNNLSAEVSAIFVCIIKKNERLPLEKVSVSYQARLLAKRCVCTFFRCQVVKRRKGCGDLFLEESESPFTDGGEICGWKHAARGLTMKFERENVERLEIWTATIFNQSKVLHDTLWFNLSNKISREFTRKCPKITWKLVTKWITTENRFLWSFTWKSFDTINQLNL